MLHKKSWLWAPAAVAALLVGMLAVGCGSDDSSASPPSWGAPPASLNGTWTASTNDGVLACTISDAAFVMKVDNVLFSKGTCETSASNFRLTITHAHGAAVNAKSAELFPPVGISGAEITFAIEEKWYTKDELKTAILDKFGELNDVLAGLDLGDIYSDDDFEEEFGEMFKQQTGTYTANGNSLSITFKGESWRFAKQ